MKPYPDGMDCVWIASDRNGDLGAFITAGIAPIPAEALRLEGVPLDEIESLILSIERSSGYDLHVKMVRPDDIINITERGFFVFDWTDI